jgi:hypothetical protein
MLTDFFCTLRNIIALINAFVDACLYAVVNVVDQMTGHLKPLAIPSHSGRLQMHKTDP